MTSIPQIEPLITARDRKAVSDYMSSGAWLTEHTETKKFEDKIAEFVGAKYCSVVPNGTIGLTLAVMALGIKSVVVPNFTMIASENAVKLAGAKPILAEVDESKCLDLNKLPKADAIMVVHLNGRSPDMKRLKKLGLPIIEDACQAFGSEHKGKKLGTFGEFGIYSFSPHKIITTGQGGAVVTDDKKLYEKIERLKDFGRLEGGEDIFPELGFNFKFTDLQAVIGISQMKDIKWRMRRKKEIYNLYKQLLGLPKLQRGQVPWMIDYYGKAKGINTRPLYPPLSKGFPVSDKVSKGVWLPSSLKLTDDNILDICDEITHSNK